LEEGSAMNSTLKVPAPEIRTLIEKIKVDLRKRAEKKAKRMPYGQKIKSKRKSGNYLIPA
jgi:hypothetical protein